jgi:transcriptional regulator with GAF, ATPase, and Fis domain
VAGQRIVGKGLQKSSHALPAASVHFSACPSGTLVGLGSSADLFQKVSRGVSHRGGRSGPQIEKPVTEFAHLDAVERDIIVRALERFRFNRTAAGSSLGLSLRQMRYRMARLGIQVAEHGPE